MKQDAAWYSGLAEKRKEQSEQLFKDIAKYEDSYFLRHYGEKSDSDNDASKIAFRHTDTAAFDYINQLIAMMTVPDPIRTFVTDDEISDSLQTICDKAEKYVAGVWRVNRSRQSIDPLRHILFNQLVRTGAFVYVYVDEARLKLYNKARKKKELPRDAYFPICIDLLNPLTCLPDYLPGRWSWTDSFIRAEKMSPQLVAGMWGADKVADIIGRDPDEFQNMQPDEQMELDYLDIWEWQEGKGDDEPQLWNGVIYGDKWIVKPRDMSERYSDMPVQLIAALDLPAEKIENRRISPLLPVIFNYKTLEAVVSRIMTVATYQADPTILARFNTPKTVQKGPGAVIPLAEGEMLTYLQGIGTSPQLMQVFQLVSGDLERSSLARANYGNASGSWSGYAINQAIAGSSLKNQPIADNLKTGLSAIDQRILSLTVALWGDDTISAYGRKDGHSAIVKVKASDLEGLRVETTLEPKTPSDEQAKMGIAMMYQTPSQATGTPLASQSWTRKNILGIQDETSMQIDIQKEKIMALPVMQKYAAKIALEKAGWPPDIAKAAMAELEQMISKGGAAGPAGAMSGAPGGAQPPASPEQPGVPATPPGDINAVLDDAVQRGFITQQQSDQAKQALQSGQATEQEVIDALKQMAMEKAGGGSGAQGAAMLPGGQQQPQGMQGQPPAQPQPAQAQQSPQPQGGQLRMQIEQLKQANQIPPDLADQAIAMLDQGRTEEEVTNWLHTEMFLLQAEDNLIQSGFGQEDIDRLRQYVQEGMKPEDALRRIVAERASGGEAPVAPGMAQVAGNQIQQQNVP